MYGDRIDIDSDDYPPSVFDELVVDRWLHVEQQNRSQWWMNISGVTVWVTVDRDGRAEKVTVYGPHDYDGPRDGCWYECKWTDPPEAP